MEEDLNHGLTCNALRRLGEPSIRSTTYLAHRAVNSRVSHARALALFHVECEWMTHLGRS